MVKFGPNSDDEMCVGYIAVVKKDQDLTMPGVARRPVPDLLQPAPAAVAQADEPAVALTPDPGAGGQPTDDRWPATSSTPARAAVSVSGQTGINTESADTTSPPLGVMSDRCTTMLRLSLMNLTDPSPNRALAPPGWNP